MRDSRKSLAWVLLVTALATNACAGSSGRPPADASSATPPRPQMAVLPARWLTLSPSVDVDAAAAAEAGLVESGGVDVRERRDAARAMASHDEECADDPECLRDVGQQVGADRVVIVRLAELGDTVLVRLSVVDLASGTREHTRQEVVHTATADAVAEVVSRIAREVGQSYAPERPTDRRWYRRWWVWTIVGVAVAGGAVGAIVATTVGGDEQPRPDVTVTPP